MIGRPRRLGKTSLAFAIPGSTSRAEKTPRMAEKSVGRSR